MDEGKLIIDTSRNEVRLKVTFFFVALLVVSSIHWGIWYGLSDTISTGMYIVIFDIGQFLHIALYPMVSMGPAFGTDIPKAWIIATGAVSLLFSTGFAILILTLVSNRYKSQIIVIAFFAAAVFAHGVEKVFGAKRVYFDIGFGHSQIPLFSIYDLAVYGTIFFLYLFATFVFFRIPPFSNKRTLTGNLAPTLHDPLYEKRKPIKIVLAYLFFVALLWVTSNGILTWIELTNSGVPTYAAILSVSFLVLLLALEFLLPISLLWRFIPTRTVDVLYLRAFMADWSIWSSARLLRRRLSPKLRIAGVVNPNEARRWYQLYYIIIAPFMFALGDFSRINVTRHNLFLEGDWKTSIHKAFSQVQAAVFDCRSMSQNLAWEIEICARVLGPDRMFFIMPAAEQSSTSKLWTEISSETIEAIPKHNFVTMADIDSLASKVYKIFV